MFDIDSAAFADAIARSISHTETVTLDARSLVSGDAESIARGEWDRQAYRDAVRATVCDEIDGRDDVSGSVVRGDVVECWGNAEDGDFRVHFKI